MLWGDKKKVALQLHVNAPSGRSYFTNNDIITGTVCLQSNSKILYKSLKVVFYGLCTSSNPDAVVNSTFNCAERHYCVKVENVLLEEDPLLGKIEQVLPPGNHVFKVNLRVPGSDLQLPCVGDCNMKKTLQGASDNREGLPPSFKFDGTKSNLEIQYSVRAYMERSGNKLGLVDSAQVTFIPTSLYAAFSVSHSNAFVKSFRESSLNYIFKVDSPPRITETPHNSYISSPRYKLNSSPQFPPGSGSSSPTDTLYRMDSFVSYASSLSSVLLKPHNFSAVKELFGSKEKYNYLVPLNISVTFYQNVYKNFDEKGVLKHRGALAQHMRIFLTSPVSPFDLFKDIIDSSEDNTQELLSLDKFFLTCLQINLAMTTTSKTMSSTNTEYSCKNFLDLKKIIHDIDLLSFQKITKECRSFYQYELDPSLFNCLVDSDIPSFLFCNAERQYQLQISGEISSAATKLSRKFSINTDVVILA